MRWSDLVQVNAGENGYICFVGMLGVSAYCQQVQGVRVPITQQRVVYRNDWRVRGLDAANAQDIREMEMAVVADAYGVTPDEVRSCVS